MVLSKEELIEQNGTVTLLKDLNLMQLERVMITSGSNTVILTNDWTVFFENYTPGKYGIYDLNVLEDKQETFDSRCDPFWIKGESFTYV